VVRLVRLNAGGRRVDSTARRPPGRSSRWFERRRQKEWKRDESADPEGGSPRRRRDGEWDRRTRGERRHPGPPVGHRSPPSQAGRGHQQPRLPRSLRGERAGPAQEGQARSEEHTSELQSREKLVCRLLLEKKNKANHCIV